MKKVFSIVIAVAMVFTLVACGSSVDAKSAETETVSSSEAVTSSEVAKPETASSSEAVTSSEVSKSETASSSGDSSTSDAEATSESKEITIKTDELPDLKIVDEQTCECKGYTAIYRKYEDNSRWYIVECPDGTEKVFENDVTGFILFWGVYTDSEATFTEEAMKIEG